MAYHLGRYGDKIPLCHQREGQPFGKPQVLARSLWFFICQKKSCQDLRKRMQTISHMMQTWGMTARSLRCVPSIDWSDMRYGVCCWRNLRTQIISVLTTLQLTVSCLHEISVLIVLCLMKWSYFSNVLVWLTFETMKTLIHKTWENTHLYIAGDLRRDCNRLLTRENVWQNLQKRDGEQIDQEKETYHTTTGHMWNNVMRFVSVADQKKTWR